MLYREAEERGYQRGLKYGLETKQKEMEKDLQQQSLKVRLELGRSFAAVFEGITRSAAMFFDGGANAFK